MKGFRSTLVTALSVVGAASALPATSALARRPTPTQQTSTTQRTTTTQPTATPVLSGDVRDANHPLVNATVAVRLFTVTGTGSDLVWSVSHTTDSAGRFSFMAGDFPVADLATKGYPASLVASASGFQAESVAFVVRKVDSLTIRAAPERVPVMLTSLDRTLYINLLLPALVGIVFAIISLTTTQVRIPLRKRGRRFYRYYQYHPAVYALAVVGLWIFAIVQIVQAYIKTGQNVVPVGPGGLTIPTPLIVTTFLGSLTYVAYTILVRSADFFEPENDVPRKELLQVVAGRVLVAPYVAAIAFGIFAPSFPQLSSPPYVLFFGFFTGLFIKPVLEALNGIGKRLLSSESRARVEERLTSQQRVEQGPITAGLMQQTDDRVSLTTDRGTLSLPVDRSRIALLLRTPGGATQVATDLGLTLSTNQAQDGFLVFKTGVTTATEYDRVVAAAKKHAQVQRVSTIFGSTSGTASDRFSFATNRVVLELKDPATDITPAVQRVLDAQHGTATKVQGQEYSVLLSPEMDPLAAAAALNAVPEVAFAEPDFVHIGGASGRFAPQPCDASPDPPDLAYQQLKVVAAWQFASTKPTTAIRVAVLDDGVDVTHPDLKSIVGEQFDSFAGEQPNPLPHDRHGTGCAGLAAATPAADGMKGVASGATLLPVRVNFTSTPGGDLVTSSSRIRRGIEWAVAHNADVLCLSWSTEPSLSVRLALETAAKSGRKGKGCVVVCAAGNDGGRVAFPALLDSVIAVAGTDANQSLKRGSDWSSNFGPEIDVAAPGTQTFTTSMQGTYQCLRGTSGAAAMIGGAAALCLRVNSALTAKEVRDLLIATSDLLPAGPAAPNGKLKFVDVEAAVKAAAH